MQSLVPFFACMDEQLLIISIEDRVYISTTATHQSSPKRLDLSRVNIKSIVQSSAPSPDKSCFRIFPVHNSRLIVQQECPHYRRRYLIVQNVTRVNSHHHHRRHHLHLHLRH